MKKTKWFLLISGIIWLVYDIIMAANGKKGDTISEVTLFYSFKNSFIPFAVGYLAGHLFWPRKKEELNIFISIGLGIVLGIITFFINRLSGISFYPIIWMTVGIPLGHFIWWQEIKK